jgi:hypothetical protein
VFANLENIVITRTSENTRDQLKAFVEFVYELSYNPILDN